MAISFHMSGIPRSRERLGSLLVLAFAVAAPTAARADFYLHPWKSWRQDGDTLNFGADFSYFTSNTNFDASGQSMFPAGLASYSRIGTDLSLSVSAGPAATLYGRMSWLRVSLEASQRAGNAFGFGDQTLGATYRVVSGEKASDFFSGFDLQAQLDIPGYSNDLADANLTPRFGDQSIDMTFGGFVNGRLMETRRGHLTLAAGAGYTYRTSGFSAAVPWNISCRYSPKISGFFGAVTGTGVVSLSTDPRGDDPALANSSTVAAGSGGSYMTSAVNPSLASLRGEGGYETRDGYRFGAWLNQTLVGKNAPAGMAFALTFEKRLGGKAAFSEGGPTGAGYAKGNLGFVNYNGTEAKVLRASDRLNLVKLNKGTQDGVETGQIFDIFTIKQDGSIGEPIARGKITSVKLQESALTVLEYFKEVWIEEGFIAKRPIQ